MLLSRMNITLMRLQALGHEIGTSLCFIQEKSLVSTVILGIWTSCLTIFTGFGTLCDKNGTNSFLTTCSWLNKGKFAVLKMEKITGKPLGFKGGAKLMFCCIHCYRGKNKYCDRPIAMITVVQ